MKNGRKWKPNLSEGAMDQLAALLSNAVTQRHAPFLVGMLGNSKGVFWTGSAGARVAGIELNERTVFRIVSMTKGVGATAAAILVERRQLDWETPVEAILPAFGKLQVLDYSKDGQFRLRPPKAKATMRQLATHTSGLVYGFWDRDIAHFLEEAGLPPTVSGLRASLQCPLAFDPGERWQYGSGLDWVGLVVEAIDGRRIDRFCRDEIFDPLQMNDTRFELEEDMTDRLVPTFGRSVDGGFSAAPIDVGPPAQPEFYGMGHALYSTASDYMRFLRMWMNQGQLDGVRVLEQHSVEHLLSNQIGDLRLRPLPTALPLATGDLVVEPGFAVSHSLGFARMEESIPGRRSAGSQFWAGVLNTHFWMDTEKDLVGILMTQLLPFLDPHFMRLLFDFERAAYVSMGPRQ